MLSDISSGFATGLASCVLNVAKQPAITHRGRFMLLCWLRLRFAFSLLTSQAAWAVYAGQHSGSPDRHLGVWGSLTKGDGGL